VISKMKSTRSQTKISITFLLCVLSHSLLAQDDFIRMMNDTIHSIKYVFEARIDSVQSYAGYKNGDPIPFSKADWKHGSSSFDDDEGNSAMVYSKVWLTVCRNYKGKLPKQMILLIKNPYVTPYAVPHPNGDTTLGYLLSYPSHGHYESPLLPSKSYPITLLYWCYDVSRIKDRNLYTLNKFGETPMLLKGSIPRPDGSSDFGILYAMIRDKIFMNQKELSEYLGKIKTLKSKPKSYCK
jgi:hypothetical protein